MSLLHKITATYSATPLVNAVAFGALTKAGAGGWKLIGTTTAVLTVDDPTHPGHFVITSGYLVPTAAFVAAPAATYVLTVTVNGIPRTINITTETNTYTVRTEAEATALTWTSGSFSGKTCAFRGAFYGGPAFYEYFLSTGGTDHVQAWWSNRLYTSLATIKAANSNDMPIIKVAGATASVGYVTRMRQILNMKFSYLDFFSEFVPFAFTNVQAANPACTITTSGGPNNTRFEHCIIRGNGLDTTIGQYFYLNILIASFSAGQIFNATLNGAALAQVSFAVSGSDAQMYADIQASIAANPDVLSVTPTGSGALRSIQVAMKSTSQSPVSFLPTWTGLTTSQAGTTAGCAFQGIFGKDGSSFIGTGAMQIANCEIYGCEVLLLLPSCKTTGSLVIEYNLYHDFGSDCNKLAGSTPALIRFNTLINPFVPVGDTAHGDFFQWQGEDITADTTDVFIEAYGNILCGYRIDGRTVPGGFKTDFQGFFSSSPKAGQFYTGCKFYNNIILTSIFDGIFLAPGNACWVWRNTVVSITSPVDPIAPYIAEHVGGSDNPVNNAFIDNIAMSYLYVGGSGSAALASGNIDADPGTLATYFTNPGVPSSVADLLIRYAPIGAAIGKGAIGTYCDFVAQTVDTTGHPWP